MAETTQSQYAAIVDAYRTRLHDRHIHLSPDIPPKKLRSAIESYAPGVDEAEVLALVDGTVMGGAKDGALLTLTALHGHEVEGQPVKVLLHDLNELATDQRPTGAVVLADGQRVFSGGVVSYEKVEIFVDLVRDVARRAGAASVPPQRLPARAPEAVPVHRAEPPPAAPAEVSLELYHLVRADWHRDAFERSAKGAFTSSSLVVTRPVAGRAREPQTCPRCRAHFEVSVYSRPLVRRYLTVGGSMLAAGLVVFTVTWLLAGAWLSGEGTVARVLGGGAAVVSMAAALVGAGIVWWATRLERSHGVQVGHVGKDDKRRGFTHTLALRS